jgi:hypothetical protein
MKIGIDLGTTNSALSFIDPREGEDSDFPPIHVLDIPQLVAPGRVETRRTLPSFLFLDADQPVGVYAREQGALVPTKLVHSAKSWLSNPDVDRTAKILPWDSPESGRALSPVEVSARFLSTMKDAWERTSASTIAEHDVVLTVPASFDEEARELTVQAAAQAGIEKLTLLEEPAAAFYSWIANNFARSRKLLFDGQVVLVCDVGGGTSDFSLIRVQREGDRIDFTRTAVGKHLLLGGDNLDLTLAWLVESKLGKQLSVRQRSGLRRQCSSAKERLLCDEHLKSVDITVAGAGTSLIGGSLRTEILREEALELALEGFLPFTGRGELPKEEKKSLFRELGLPYVTDPAITRHLNQFLETAAQAPDAILFNGGFFIPDILRHRVADVVEKWYGKRPEVFDNRDLDLAVSAGASYYSYVRSTGSGILVRGGLPRAYFVGIGEGGEKIQTVCLVPRGTEEGSTLELDRESLQLVANKPVSFRLYSSLTRTDDAIGDMVEFDPNDDSLHTHAPLNAVIRFGKPGAERLVPVKVGARLTEVGTLETWCESKISDNRWRLQFELRKSAAQPAARKPAAVVSDESMQQSLQLVREMFSPTARSPVAPEELPAKLEQTLGLARNSWPLSAIRQMADIFLEYADGRKTSPAYEVRWLNLCGFCLRPGFGFPGDDYRIEQTRRVYAAGLTYGNQVQNEVDWWIFWGRVAGGMNRNQQVDLFQRCASILLPKAAKGGKPAKPVRVNSSLLREMWRTASSLELLPLQTKTELGDALIKTVRAGSFRESELWCLSRLGARRLLYGPVNQVLPVATVTRWVEVLAGIKEDKPMLGDALAAMARLTGDPVRDLAPVTRETVRRTLQAMSQPERFLEALDAEDEGDESALGRIFGEELPSGLVIASSAEV